MKVGLSMILGICCFAQNTWLETTQEDFASGIFERNLYASRYEGGALEFVPRFDLNNDGYIEIFVTDRLSTNVRVYWGSDSGYYNNNVTIFSRGSGANCDCADLNYDGYPDFIINHYFSHLSIYWGTPTGPSQGFYFDIPMVGYNRQGVFIADYNKDGYLDIATTQEQISGFGAVFWGDSLGYSVNRRTDLYMTFGVHNMESADLNWDGWLDLVITEYYGSSPGNCKIFWGSSTGFSNTNTQSLPAPEGNHGLSIADLNRDRNLDLIVTGWYDPRAYIYWGSATGYSQSNQQVLNPGYSYGGSSVADLDSDGFLDIVFHRGGYGSAYQRIYWGSATGYSDANSQGFGYSIETSGGFIADFNNDNNLDIFSNSNAGSSSYIFWGPQYNTATLLQCNDDHHGHFREIGNVYNRSYMEHYISSVFDAGETVLWQTASWDDSLPDGTSIQFRVRTGNTPEYDSTWSTWYQVDNGGTIPSYLNSQYIQYMANLYYNNPCYLPMLKEVQIEYYYFGVQENASFRDHSTVNISPNPFAFATRINFVVTSMQSHVCLKIFDSNGRCVRTLVSDNIPCGQHCTQWAGEDDRGKKLPKGIYFLETNINNQQTLTKVIYIK